MPRSQPTCLSGVSDFIKVEVVLRSSGYAVVDENVRASAEESGKWSRDMNASMGGEDYGGKGNDQTGLCKPVAKE